MFIKTGECKFGDHCQCVCGELQLGHAAGRRSPVEPQERTRLAAAARSARGGGPARSRLRLPPAPPPLASPYSSFLHNIRLHKELLQSGGHGKHENVRSCAIYAPQGMIMYSEGNKVKVCV